MAVRLGIVTLQGNYGAGTVMVWDTGTYEASGDNPSAALRAGKLHLWLKGKKLKGEWTGEVEKYTASYSGAFVRRSAKLAGSQTWQHEGKTFTRKCEGAIKRPFAVFLPGEGPPEEKK